jgi:inner membrane protein
MASTFTHAVAALSIGTCFYERKVSKVVWIGGAVCSVIPDLDVIGFRFGIPYGSFWGHRGFTHSLMFAVLLSVAATTVLLRRNRGIGRFALFAYLFIATASHGILDAMTSGGLGVAFFSPFDNSRYFLPWRRIAVSPIAIHRFFSARGFAVLRSELLWVWIPAAVFAGLVLAIKRTNHRDVIV